MNNETREIDLIQYAIYLWKRIVIVFVVSIAGALVALGYSYYKQKNVSPADSSREVISTIVSQNRTAFYAPDNQPKPYTFDTVPSGACNSNAKLYIDYNYSIIEGSDILDFEKISEQFQNDAALLLVSSTSMQNVIDELNLTSYPDMTSITPETLRWMVTGSFNGSNVMEVFVTDSDPERAQKIAEAVVSEFVSKSEEIDAIDSVKVIDAPSIPGGSSVLSSGTTINKKTLIKYSLVGFVACFIIIAFIIMVEFVIKPPIMNEEMLDKMSIKVIGTVSRKSGKKKNDIKRIASDISLIKESNMISYIPVDDKTEAGDCISLIFDELKGRNKNIEIKTHKGLLSNPDVLPEVMDSDSVMLGVTYGVTKMKDIIFSIEEINKTGKTLLGVVINNK